MARVFDLPRTDRVVYGQGAIRHAREETLRLGIARPLVVASRTLATTTAVVGELAAELGAVALFTGVPAHVPQGTVLDLARRFRESAADGLVSVGGGSPIDCAKGAALCVSEGIRDEEHLARYRIRYRHPGPSEIPVLQGTPPPHLAVSTTLSGAEFTSLAGITDPVRGVKELYRAEALCPARALLDPDVAAHTPRALWLASGVRAVDHVVEGVCSSGHTPLTDAVLPGALRILTQDLLPSAEDPSDRIRRGNCQVAAWMAIMHLKNVPMGLSHGLGHQLGALLGVPHGITSCVLLPHVMDFNAPVSAARQALLAPALEIDTKGLDEESAAAAVRAAVRALIARLGVPNRLADVGVARHHFGRLAEEALRDPVVAGNPRPAASADVLSVLEAAF
ncbi:iron-containing alcohol dehydrogenase [Amycolatopsis sp. Poz14]|uniref:iron-containing alcohol dehydrogenase n=1 Tax=Amycolatopsis sp. Poz14 TaxID=1447705 RepID=UPI001EE797DE|nr:iron-containing alcohol dehydrogenase [Amycolatopsis sp. Poz14]MCG3753995.1 iron-containing alcohol dehydrogenase [Amycolatopsis sp. Poz14]